MYVHKEYQRQGIATAICDELEKAVKGKKIITQASITAKSFFEHGGIEPLRNNRL
ncbi:MAG: GNAT family N-acetyltransferase [Candidatus Onthovivens sp.]|nr:GNAT family N-acetyltransferase [Candidatus Onthovivens sp.]